LGNAFAYGLVGCIPSIHALIVGVIITRVTVATVTTCEYNNFAKLSRKRVL
jgi:hypothetical protein